MKRNIPAIIVIIVGVLLYVFTRHQSSIAIIIGGVAGLVFLQVYKKPVFEKPTVKQLQDRTRIVAFVVISTCLFLFYYGQVVVASALLVGSIAALIWSVLAAKR